MPVPDPQDAVHTLAFHQLPGSDTQLGVFADIFTLREPMLAHRHDFLELAFAVKGSGQHEAVQGRFPFLSGDVWGVQPGQWHAYPSVRDTVAIFNLLLSHDFLLAQQATLSTIPFVRPLLPSLRSAPDVPVSHLRLSPQGLDRIYALLVMLAQEVRTPQAEGCSALCTGLVLQILALIDRSHLQSVLERVSTSSHTIYPAGVLAALQYIEEHFREPLTLAEVARQSGYTPGYLVRTFHDCVGMPPIDYMLQVRLQHACTLLHSTKQAITAIAFTVGFSDSCYFSTRFRRAFGLTPSEFRRTVQVNMANKEAKIIKA